ncbi:MAG: IS1 family transposase, partial [Candidatus Krumholzibacteria bacterium]|nr:IS1 family transposase [Candidatus Krumholzibacteria bacterium]
GGRDAGWATAFLEDLAARLRHRVQMTSDGHGAYLRAVEDVFGCEIDYATLVKLYGRDKGEVEHRYSPPVVVACQCAVVTGNPDPRHISTSFAERQNLTMRMSMRRFTRLTNGFSKKLENLRHAVALHFMYYNFCRIHQTLRITPAMAAGVTDHLWEIDDILRLLDSN